MKKRIILLLCAALLFTFGVQAETASPTPIPALSEELFMQAKEALTRLSYGEYDQISPLLSYSGEAPAATDWQLFAEIFQTLNNGTVQREVAVGFWRDDAWYIAVPVLEPTNEMVEAMVFISADGTSFSGFGVATWGGVQEAYYGCEYVVWNEEYVENPPIIVSD